MSHRVTVLVLPGVLPLEFGTAVQIFGTDPHYDLTVCAAGPVHDDGFCLTVSAGLGALAHADTIVIPGYRDISAKPPAGVLAALQDSHQRGARLVSICSAAFALAAAGLLDGRPATTHWQVASELRRQYPLVDVVPNCLYVDDGDILTSAGVTAGIDLCLHLIRRDYGAAAANSRARALVAAPQRAGSQAQYVERLLPDAAGNQLEPVRAWLLEHLAEPIDLDAIAGSAGMSRRTLVRRFREETRTSPMAWLTDARLDRARELLELTDEPVENLGRLTGLGSPASVRAIFHRRLATSPQDYRAMFRHRTASRARSPSSAVPER